METMYRCQDCDWFTDDAAYLAEYTGKLQPGAKVPDGECPECGAICFADETPEEQAAGRLRLAAPALLAALEAVAEQLSDLLSRYNSEDYTAIDAARAAIARARGVSA